MTNLRVARWIVLGAVISLCAAACGSAAATPTSGSDCQHWCGSASASVTLAGKTATISGGGCFDGGAAGIDVRIGDWQNGVGDFLQLSGYRPGGPTAAPTVQPTDDSGNPEVTPRAIGSVSGTPFISDDAAVTFTSATSGKFQGTDVNGYGPVTGTFTCG